MLQLKVNTGNLVKHLRFAFSNRDVALREMLQNSRRAKASRIVIEHDPEQRVLTITDDGTGIEDFQVLLSLAESGWDPETIERENPFGLGFYSGLTNAKHIEVESNGMRLSAATQDILDFRPVGLTPCEPREGTRITLREFAVDDVAIKLGRLVMGFPVEVICNNEVLPRPHAVDGGLDFLKTPIGLMHVHELYPGTDSAGPYPQPAGSLNFMVYYQGFPVIKHHSGRNIVHLDSTQFRARLPDRDCLYDENEAMQRISAALLKIWRERLLAIKSNVDAATFADTCYLTARSKQALDLFNDIDVVPASALEMIGDYPAQLLESGENLKRYPGRVTRRDVEDGSTRVCEVPFLDAGDGSMLAWNYAYLKNAVLLDSGSLHPGHWLHRHVVDLFPEDITLTLVRPAKFARYDGNWIWRQDVVLCEAYRLDGPIGSASSDELAIYADGFVALHRHRPAIETDLVVVPHKAQGGYPVTQLTSFIDENDQFDDAARDAEMDTFGRFVLSLKGRQNSGKVLRELLVNAGLARYPGMSGTQFRVAITATGKVRVKRLKAA